MNCAADTCLLFEIELSEMVISASSNLRLGTASVIDQIDGGITFTLSGGILLHGVAAIVASFHHISGKVGMHTVAE